MQSAHEAAGATGIRRSPRPRKGGQFSNGSGASRREAAKPCLEVAVHREGPPGPAIAAAFRRLRKLPCDAGLPCLGAKKRQERRGWPGRSPAMTEEENDRLRSK